MKIPPLELKPKSKNTAKSTNSNSNINNEFPNEEEEEEIDETNMNSNIASVIAKPSSDKANSVGSGKKTKSEESEMEQPKKKNAR